MKLNQATMKLIKEFEGCHLHAYKDAVGVVTIGYGTTNADSGITGKTIRMGMTIGQATADKWLQKSLEKKYLPKVMKYDHIYHWNENEAGALTSFAYNIGSIDQLTDHGKRSKATIAKKMLLYNKADNKVLLGLKRRREAEHNLFLTPVKTEEKPMEKETITYFKKYTGKHDGIVKILDAKGYDSSFESRAKIAKLNGIKNYTGTAEQNEKMVKLIKAGKLIKKKVK